MWISTYIYIYISLYIGGFGYHFTKCTFGKKEKDLELVLIISCQRGEIQVLLEFKACFEIIVGNDIIVRSPYMYVYIYIYIHTHMYTHIVIA